MLPDYFIYDQLKKEREKLEQLRERPRLEIPRYPDYRPDFDEPATEQESERGEAVLQF